MLAQDWYIMIRCLQNIFFWVTDSTDKAFEGEREMTPVWKDVLSGPGPVTKARSRIYVLPNSPVMVLR